ncbi:MAG: hypothetical protein ACQETL_01195 [Bacteroidota bacterium]
MKSFIKKYSITAQFSWIFMGIFFLCSCELVEIEEKFSIVNEDNAIPKLDVSFGASSVFNLSSSEGAFVDIILESKQEFSESVELYAAINSADNPSILISTIETVPAEVKLSIEDLRAALEAESIDLNDGDSLFFTFQTKVNEEIYQFNNSALSSEVICNSMISTAEDTWTGEGFSDNGASFPSTSTVEDVTITPLEGDNYLISDISAGWYEAIGFRAQQEGIYNDDCNQITWVGPGENRQFEFVDPGIEGSWDPQTGTLTIYWFDEGNDFKGESVFTKNE